MQDISDALFPKTRDHVIVEYIESKDRLIVSSAALGLVIGALSLLTFISAALCVRTKARTPSEPMTIASKAEKDNAGTLWPILHTT